MKVVFQLVVLTPILSLLMLLNIQILESEDWPLGSEDWPIKVKDQLLDILHYNGCLQKTDLRCKFKWRNQSDNKASLRGEKGDAEDKTALIAPLATASTCLKNWRRRRHMKDWFPVELQLRRRWRDKEKNGAFDVFYLSQWRRFWGFSAPNI
jgi:hypothetical protein